MADRPTPSTTMQDQSVERKLTLLSDIRRKWDKFSKQELSDLKNSNDLVTQLVAKYGLEKDAATRDAAGIVKGRAF